MRKILICLFLLMTQTLLFPVVKKGYIDLSSYDFFKGEPVDLSGEWYVIGSHGEEGYMRIPGNWGNDFGHGTYILDIKTREERELVLFTSQISTKFSIYVNDIFIFSDDLKRPHYIPLELRDGLNQIRIEVDNHLENQGGIRNRPLLGHYKKMLRSYEISILKDIGAAGASFIFFILFLSLYFYYREDRSNLYIALICLSLSLRAFVTNDNAVNLFLKLPYTILDRAEYGSVFVLPVLLLLFVKSFFKKRGDNKLNKVLTWISLVFPLVIIILPPRGYMAFYYPFLFFAMVVSLYIVAYLLYMVLKRESDATRVLISVLALIAASIYDISIVLTQSSQGMILSRVIIIFIFLMALIITFKQIRGLKKITNLARDNYHVNSYLKKFVPKEFIKTIGTSDIHGTNKGDGCIKEMTILFSNIKDLYKKSSLLKGEDVMNYLNRCISIVTPIIERNGGFIDKYMDETIMAIFPDSPRGAIDAALEISRATEENNRRGVEINIYSGIHVGDLYIGIVGDEKRIDATVISKNVNTASRIGSFNRKIDREILISEDVYNRVEDREGLNASYMGSVLLKGSRESLGIYSVDSYRESRKKREEKEADRLFSMAMRELRNSTLERIESVLLSIRKIYNQHKPTKYYLRLIKENKKLQDLEK